ncbi:MAG: hypothetical protein QGI46_05355, partial [Planctomycetota bacterium]|nr:hypothetical protein [Planctomycetota bacterium]
MSEVVPPLIEPASLARGVLCVAAGGADAVLACGGALALAARQGAHPTVLVLAGPKDYSATVE